MVNLVDGLVDALQRLQPLGHEHVGEAPVDGLHVRRHAQDPLLVRVGRVVVGRRVVCGDVEEEVRELRRRVLGAVRRGEAEHQHHRLAREVLLALPQERHRVVRDQVRVVVLVVVVAVLDALAVEVDGVVVVARVHDEAGPLAPAGRDVAAVVLVQVLAEVACAVSGVGEVRGEGARLVAGLPLRRGAVVVVGVDVVVVHVHAGQQAGARRAAHGRRHVRVPELRAAVAQQPQRARHEVQRAELDVLVVGEEEDDVGAALLLRGLGAAGVRARPPLLREQVV